MDRCHTVFHILNHVNVLIARLLEPFMPETSNKINNFISDGWTNYEHNTLQLDVLTFKSVRKPDILFKKIADEQIDELKQKFS